MEFKRKVFSYLLFCFSLLAIMYFVSANYSVTTSSSANNFTFNEDTNNLYNITINNSYIYIDANVTQVNITFPSGFIIVPITNGTDSNGVFSNLSSTLTWENSSGVVPYNSTKYFWINASVANPGNYTLNITLTNSSGTEEQHINITISNVVPNVTALNNYSLTKSSITVNWTTNEIANCTLYYGNATQFIENNNSATSHTVNITSLVSSTRYSYYVRSCDEYNNCSNSINYTFTTQSLISNASFFNYNSTQNKNYSLIINNSDANANVTQINITLPLNFTFVSNSNSDDFEASFNQSGRVLSWTNESGMVLNQTINRISFNATTVSNLNGTFNLTVIIINTFGSAYSNISVNIRDVNDPNINLDSSESVDTDSAIIEWTSDEDTNYTLEWGLDTDYDEDPINENSYDNSASETLSDLSDETTYYYKVTVYDRNGNSDSGTGSFTTDAEDGSSGGGGGDTDTGFWTSTDSYSDKELSVRGSINTSLAKGERARIKIDGDRFYVGIIKLTSSSATINVSELDNIWLSDKYSSGDTKKYEVTGDNYYDLEITLRSIKNNEANISIKYLHEIKSNTLNRPSFNDTDLDTNLSQNGTGPTGFLGGSGLTSQPTKIILYIIIAVVVLLVIGIIINTVGKLKKKGYATEEEGLINKVKKEIKTKSSKKDKVNVKSP